MSRLKINTKGIEYFVRTILLTILAACASSVAILAQQVIVNSNGDRIIMFPDGSWRPLAPQDSILLQQYLNTSGSEETTMTSVDGPERNKAEEQEFLLRRFQDIKRVFLLQEKKVQNEFRAATNAQFKASAMLRNAEDNKEVIEPDRLADLKITYENSVAQLRNAKLNQTAIQKLVSHVQTISNNPDRITRRKLDQLQSRYNLYVAHFEPSTLEASRLSAKEKEERSAPKALAPKQKSQPVPVYAKSALKSREPAKKGSTSSGARSLSKSIPYRRQPYACNPSLDSMDEATGRRHVVLPPAVVFTHTDPDLRPFLKDRELITCKAWLWKIGPYIYMDVDFYISSSHSQKNFGSLAKGSLLRIKLLNEDYVSLYNLKTDRGRIDPYTGNTVFSGQYALGKEEIKALRKSEIDKIRVLWGTGYEDYDVYNVDFFLDQLECLMSR